MGIEGFEEFEEFEEFESLKGWGMFRVPCSMFRVVRKESSATGIIVVGEQPDIIENMLALTGRRKFEKYVFLVL